MRREKLEVIKTVKEMNVNGRRGSGRPKRSGWMRLVVI